MKVKKKKRIEKYYEEVFDFIKESRNYIYFSVLIFLIFSFIGFFFPVPDSLRGVIMNFIEELLLKTQDMSHGGLIWFILLNNIQSSFFGMIYGILFGIFPIMASLANGYLLGFVASEAVKSNGISVLWRLFPHGIFELPALFISLGLGIKLGMGAIINYFNKNKNKKIIFKGVLSLILALPSLLFLIISLNLLFNPSFFEMLLPNISSLTALFFFVLGILFLIPFIHFFLFTKYFSSILKKSVKTFFLVVVPLLILAAIIEGSLIFLFS